MGETKGHNCFGRNPLRIGPLGTARSRWEDNIKIVFREMRFKDQWRFF
jgi:hypothetical protein